ncbi:unnamed protein product [Kluyveromyces dobzhanskii CBS 2104]|uniref:WGS project CCBQ000000000 data, contig 00015 n=1 Tax=Kluyveromyces dobzhanskii CBS 2104 TaxID=1427455 RepID=A0A0A8LC54_9SACH|nr:unnamed protein product [Kluyveromyces dobzhanskii CBS 2104]
MGLCGSKHSEDIPVGVSHKTAPKSNKQTASKQSAGTQIDATHTANDLPPREAARIAAEERNAKVQAANSKSELSQKLASERAKSRKAHVMEIAQK